MLDTRVMTMASRRVGSVFTSSIFTIGLLVIIIVLLFNYWMLLTRNGTVIREAHKLRLELQHATLSNNQSAKKLEGCQVDALRFETQIKELKDVVQKKVALLSEIGEQVKQTKSLYSSVLEEKKLLTQSLTETRKEKDDTLTMLDEEKKKCQENAKSLAKECLDVCDSKVNEAKKEAKTSCQKRITELQQQVVKPKVVVAATNSTNST